MGLIPEAIADLDRALELTADPGQVMAALSERGMAHRIAGRFEAAIGDLDRALGIGDSGWSHGVRGLAYAGLGRCDEALADLRIAADDESITSAWPTLWCGVVAAKVGLPEEANERLSAAIDKAKALVDSNDTESVTVEETNFILGELARGRSDEAHRLLDELFLRPLNVYLMRETLEVLRVWTILDPPGGADYIGISTRIYAALADQPDDER